MVWSTQRAQAWYSAQGDWKQGVNFVPSYAVNQIQHWQDYNATTIARELSWAANLKYNALRVFLHDQMYTYQGDAFLDKVDDFLTTAHDLGFQTILVLLEGIWDPNPQYTPGFSQPEPRPFVHNSRWLQSPGAVALQNQTILDTEVRSYVEAIVKRFGNDTDRVLMLDLMDQPENPNLLSYGAVGERVLAAEDAFDTELEPSVKLQVIQQFIPQLLDWVEQADLYRQVPVTIADWHVDSLPGTLGQIQEELRQVYLNASDIITFHHYGPNVLDKLEALQTQFPGRPVVLSSFMARDEGSRFDPIMGDLYARNVWAMNWGLVNGAIQTVWNSDSWNERYVDFPDVWHHDVLWPNGTVYNATEQAYLLSFRNDVDGIANTTTTINNNDIATTPPDSTLAPTNVTADTAAAAMTAAPSMDNSRLPALDPKQKPQINNDGESWIGPQWAATCVTLVGILGLVAIVLVCICFCRRRKARVRARTISASLDHVEHAEVLDLNEFT